MSPKTTPSAVTERTPRRLPPGRGTTADNVRSRAVMERLGMTRSAADDFEHPALASGDPLRPHVLYRIRAPRKRILAPR